MGGYGSGPPKGKPFAEEALRLSIRDASKSPWHCWSCNGKDCGSIFIEVLESSLALVYSYNKEPVRDIIQVTSTSCNYGGYRDWFVCPGCSRRVAVLFAVGKYFRCRHCQHITYKSRNEDFAYQLTEKQNKIRKKLKLKPGSFGCKRPKGMHKKTFLELNKKLLDLEFDLDIAWRNAACRLLGI